MRETPSPPVAAVDLGSNSFHMVVARLVEHDIHVLDRMREQVRLAAGLDDDGHLTDEAQERALACLERIGQRLRHLRPGHMRAVGTNSLRRARNRREFRIAAQKALGHPIEVISGQEEARLIYLGVAHSLPSDPDHRLVVDIGGGSTEIILGEGFDVLQAHSLFMGCITYTERFFPGGGLHRDAFRRAEIAAQLELRAIRGSLRELAWRNCAGASGTIHAVRAILRHEGWDGETITLAGLKRLRKTMVAAGEPVKLRLPLLKPERARILPGGLAILIGLFKSLGIEAMRPSNGALREGVLYDLVGRIRHEDVRDRTIRRLVDRYHVDVAQAARVERTAMGLLAQFGDTWGLEPETARKPLAWASRLHELGLAVSYTGHHKHGEYLVAHSDLPGFSSDDQQLLASLIRSHRRRLPKALFAGLSHDETFARRLSVILRLAALLNRSRTAALMPAAAVDPDGDTLTLGFRAGWAADHPLSLADLEREASYLKAFGLRLRIVETGARAAVEP